MRVQLNSLALSWFADDSMRWMRCSSVNNRSCSLNCCQNEDAGRLVFNSNNGALSPLINVPNLNRMNTTVNRQQARRTTERKRDLRKYIGRTMPLSSSSSNYRSRCAVVGRVAQNFFRRFMTIVRVLEVEILHCLTELRREESN